MAYIGRGLDKISNVEVLDNITFDGSSSYTLQKGGVNFTPSSANNILVSIDGVVQAGNFTCSGSTIDFGVAVSSSSTCNFIIHYGVGVTTIPSDGSVTSAKLSSGTISLSGGSFRVEDGYAYGFGDNSYRIEGKDDGANARIGFVTNSSEIARFTTDGLTFNGDTAAANALDDYEEGTWTPDLTTAGGTLSVTYSERAGKYTKIGEMVFFECYIETSAFSGGTGAITFGGLPFTVESGRGAIGIAHGSRIDFGVEAAVTRPLQSTSTFRISIKNSTGTGSSDNSASLDASDWSNLNPTLVYATGQYRTDS